MHSKQLRILVISALLLISGSGVTQGPDKNYKLIHATNFVQSKNYYLLTLLEQTKDVRNLIDADTALFRIKTNRLNAINEALKTCDRKALCFTNALKFSDNEISVVGDRLKALWQSNNALGKLVTNHLIPSGNYILFQKLAPAEMLAKAWKQDAEGINFAISVYAEGMRPNYPLIDSISIRNNNGYLPLLYNTSYLLTQDPKTNAAFFSPTLYAALRFFELNEREQAADFEPMAEGENKAAIANSKTIAWNKYKYSVILVPGAGPDEPGVALSAEGMLRCRLAAIQYHKGIAPFIIPSGGKVHPYKTKFCEATEMKKYLIEKLNVPANAIIIEPHARHTTTNMRNAARLIYRYGIPFDKAGITCTTRGQSAMIEKTLIDRCMRELNEVPYRNGQRLSETEIEFYPLLEALHINPKEPMDP